MFQVGDKVVYGIHGVCVIADQEQRVVDRRHVTYLVLEPVGQAGARYLVPTHNAAAMGKLKHMLTRQELEALLQSPEVRQDAWIRDENQRKNAYRELISSGDRGKLLCMVHTLYVHKATQTAAGRKCHLCDENFLRDAEKLLCGEFSMVLEQDYDQVKQYLRENLS